jgi:hypothetical protein
LGGILVLVFPLMEFSAKPQLSDSGKIVVSSAVESLFTEFPTHDRFEMGRETYEHQTSHRISTAYRTLSFPHLSYNWGNTKGHHRLALSPLLANIFMTVFDMAAIEFSPIKPKCWYRYADDVFSTWPPHNM